MNRFELLPGEKIIIANPKHWKNYIGPVAAAVACLAAAVLKLTQPEFNAINWILGKQYVPEAAATVISRLEAVVLVVTAAAMALAMVSIAFTRYYVTNQRIVAVAGWLNVRTSEMLLDRCETVSLSQRISERLFNSGDLLCISAGASIYLDDVYDARRFRQTVMAELTKHDNEKKSQP